ncbi:TonB-dependent receptor [Ohtaekwangia kribbensis]|uniref:TonB-dependent receptor n=1 Tax=Ohtaekwangia kribbensis TaxID=688913 RepID=A0ABW3K4H7_9BACT
MKRLLLTLSSIILLSCVAFAQGEISGKITNGDAQPLQGVTVHLLNTNYGAVTDASGAFTIINVPSGEYTLFVSAVGYASIQQPVTSGASALSITLTESVTQLDDVVVTAQKTEEPLQRIPFSISALSARKVNEYRLWNVKDITAIAPNVFSSNPGDNRNVTSIRGITSTSYDPAVATYIDGVNQFSLDTYIAQLFDVERIEILRGPQGTLYGRNAMAGVINIITKEPGNTTRGFVEANIGNYGQQRYGFGVRTPLVANKLFLGVAGMYDANSGFYKNDFNNSDFDKKYNITGNYYLKYLATSKLAVTLNVKHSINRNDGAFPLAGSVEGALSEPFKVNQNATTTLVDNVFNSSLNINYAGDVVNFSSLTTYQSNDRIYDDPIDGDFSPIDGITIINDYGKDWNNVKVFTQEFKVSSPAASTSPLKWTAGAYLFHQDNPVKQATHFGEDAAYIDENAMPFSAILNTSDGSSKGIAFYGQATYAFSDKLDLTAGVRYDYEKKKQNVHGEFLIDGMNEPVFETQPDTAASTSFSAFSPKLSLAFHPTPNHTIYITSSRGFRAGGLTQLSSDPSQAPLYAYKPEYSTNAELGFKNSFLNDRLQVNVAAYYIKVTDAQVPTLILPDAITVTRNAGELSSIGAELEVSATLVKGLQLDYAAGINKATYDDLVLPQNGEQVNFDGNRQIYTPQHTSMLAAQYSYTLKSSGITLIARGEWMNLGKQYFDLANNIKQSGYSIFNARAGAAFRNFELMFWGRNLSDETYISYAYDFGATHLGNPRNYGATFRWNF